MECEPIFDGILTAIAYKNSGLGFVELHNKASSAIKKEIIRTHIVVKEKFVAIISK